MWGALSFLPLPPSHSAQKGPHGGKVAGKEEKLLSSCLFFLVLRRACVPVPAGWCGVCRGLQAGGVRRDLFGQLCLAAGLWWLAHHVPSPGLSQFVAKHAVRYRRCCSLLYLSLLPVCRAHVPMLCPHICLAPPPLLLSTHSLAFLSPSPRAKNWRGCYLVSRCALQHLGLLL